MKAVNKTALITGAAKRIGKAIAAHLAGHGWNIAVHYNTSDKEAKILCDELSSRYPDQQFESFAANLSDMLDVEKLIPAAAAKYEKIDLLINNASAFEPASIADSSIEFLEKQMKINFMAPFILCRDFSKYAKSGNIVNFVDTRIVKNQSNFAVYSLSKKTLWELTKMAATEFGPAVRVNAIAPGLTLPPGDKDESYLWKLADKIPMKRPGGVDPIIKSLDYILENEYLTGQILYCDGGENLI
jgi:Dehydrogenases with different specificities (related to short-chain alcohol dehydrogenases)